MNESGAVTDPLPYRVVTEPEYAANAARTFVVETYPEGRLLRGDCPRCGATIEVPLVDEMFSRRPVPGPSPADQAEPVICTCREPHPGRPADDVGCGAYWVFVIPAETS